MDHILDAFLQVHSLQARIDEVNIVNEEDGFILLSLEVFMSIVPAEFQDHILDLSESDCEHVLISWVGYPI